MQDLQLMGVHEDGEHLLLSGPDNSRFRIPVDEALRAAIRRDRPRLGKVHTKVEGGLRPRDVQALIRAGASAEEAASRAGWTVEKVHRYEGPIVAEREHIAGLARTARLRARTGAHNAGSAPTLSVRVAERLKGRGVEADDVSWDSWRAEGGPWTVVLTFAAGGRQRQASWTFDLADRTVSAVDDEARWLSEDVQATNGPIPAPTVSARSARATGVYDVEAEGGLQPIVQHHEDPLDLMTAMRKRSTARGRRKTGSRGSPKAAPVHADEHPAENQDMEQMVPEIGADLSARGDQGSAHDEVSAHDGDRAGGRTAEGRERERSSPHGSGLTPEPMEDTPPQSPASVPPSRPAPRPAARKNVRPSIPAWDEIMFGSRPDADRSSS